MVGLVEAGGGEGENLAAGFGDADHVFVLGGEAAVAGDGGPVVFEDFDVGAAGVDHGLDGEEHAGFEHGAFAFAAEMQDIGGGVEFAADAVAAEIADHAKAVGFDVGLDGVADVAEGGAGADGFDAEHEGLIGDVHQVAGAGVGFARDIHAAGVAVPAIEDHGDVDVEDVAFEEAAVAGDAVTDDVVDRDAGGFGIAAIAQRGGDGAVGDDVIVADLVEIAGHGAGADVRGDHVEGFGGQAAGGAHWGEVLEGVDYDASLFAAAVHGVTPWDHPGVGYFSKREDAQAWGWAQDVGGELVGGLSACETTDGTDHGAGGVMAAVGCGLDLGEAADLGAIDDPAVQDGALDLRVASGGLCGAVGGAGGGGLGDEAADLDGPVLAAERR